MNYHLQSEIISLLQPLQRSDFAEQLFPRIIETKMYETAKQVLNIYNWKTMKNIIIIKICWVRAPNVMIGSDDHS